MVKKRAVDDSPHRDQRVPRNVKLMDSSVWIRELAEWLMVDSSADPSQCFSLDRAGPTREPKMDIHEQLMEEMRREYDTSSVLCRRDLKKTAMF